MISHPPPTVPSSSPAKCPNFFPVSLAVAAPTTQSASLSNLHLRHQFRHQHSHRLLASQKEAAGGPGVFLQGHDEDDERTTSASLSGADGGELEASAALEDEIFDFMLKSPNPSLFPTKKELIAAGRMDLADAIVAHGGWLAYGWDLDEKLVEDAARGEANNINGIASHSSLTNGGDRFFADDSRIFQQRSSSSSASDCQDSAASQSSSGRSIETEGGEDIGIEGILSRLEKERDFLRSVESDKKENRSRVSGKNCDRNQQDTSADAVAGSKTSSRSVKGFLKSGDISHTRSSHKPETWRMWSAQRAGLPETEFEAEEIVPYESVRQSTTDDNSSSDVAASSEIHTMHESLSENGNPTQTNNETGNFRNEINARIQQLQSELTSVLYVLRSGTDAIFSNKVERGSLEELHKLSDAWEFQQTEIMKTKDKLRSMRAKLAVLEGKTALEVIEAQKMVEERQKRIENSQKALNILRTAKIVWPNPASEVILAGSFDGWTSQRRMERSTSGIFSLNLKLYPGQYEIKFIVDGVWRTDPLRPVVNTSGYENNLLLVS